MAKSINLQANKVESIVAINYITPSSSMLDIVPPSTSDITNYSQISETSLRNCNMRGSGALINLGSQDQQNGNTFDSETTDSTRRGFKPLRRDSFAGSNLRYAPYLREDRDSSYENVRTSKRTEGQERYSDVGHERLFHRNYRLDAEHEIFTDRDNASDRAHPYADNRDTKASEKRRDMPYGKKISSGRNNYENAWSRVVRPTTRTSDRAGISRIHESAEPARMNSSNGHCGRSFTPKSYCVPPFDFSAKHNYDSDWVRVVRPTSPRSEIAGSSRIPESAQTTLMDSSRPYFGSYSTPIAYHIQPSDFRYKIFEEDDGYGMANWYAKSED